VDQLIRHAPEVSARFLLSYGHNFYLSNSCFQDRTAITGDREIGLCDSMVPREGHQDTFSFHPHTHGQTR